MFPLLGRTRLWNGLLGLVAIAATVLWAATSFALFQQCGRPFPGFLYEPNLVVSTLRLPEWQGTKQGLVSYDRLLRANGHRLDAPEDLARLVRGVPAGTPIQYELLRNGERKLITIETSRLSGADILQLTLLWLLNGGGFLLVGIVVFWLKPAHPAAQAHLVMTLACGLTQIELAEYMLVHRAPWLLFVPLFWLGSGLIHLSMTMPVVRPSLQRRPALALLPYLPAVLGTLFALALWRPVGYSANPSVVDLYFTIVSLWSLWTLIGILSFLGSVLYAWFRPPSTLARSQAGVVLLGTLGGFAPLTLNFIVPDLLGQSASIASSRMIVECLGFHFFPLSVAYAILRHQLFDIRLVVRRATLYAALTLGLAFLYVLCATLAFGLLGTFLPSSSGASLPGFFAAVAVAIAFRPLHDALRRAIDRLFLGERADALQVLKTFSQSASTDEGTLAQELAALIRQALNPQWVGVQVNDRLLAVSGTPSEIPLNEAGLVLPIKLEGEGEGVLFLGPRTNEMPYNPEELAMLKVLAAQAALAFKNAHLFAERVQLLVQEGVSRTLAHERKQLLMQVVHDLKSDLSNINGAVQLSKKMPDEQAPLNAIIQSVDQIEGFLEEKVRWLQESQCVTPEAFL